MSDFASLPKAPREVLEEVSKKYERTLVIPEQKPSPQWLLMPVGLIGSGKTTVVTSLAEHFGLIRVSTDEIRKLLRERGYSFDGAREITEKIVHTYLALGYSLVIDGNTGSTFGLTINKRTEDVFPHVPQIFIHINPSEEFIIKMLRKRSKTWLHEDGEAAVEHYFKNKNSFTLPDLPFVYTFDTSREDMPTQINKCIEEIERVLKAL